MAGVVRPARASAARLLGQSALRNVTRRGFHASTRDNAAQNYAMPALSPTMTEGNIASWRIKEGASFSAGDVILEIETDKATMDVEAQDDGILMKITVPDGSKGVQVGQRIAVTAEAGDDISSLEIPAEDKGASAQPAPKQGDAKSEEEASTKKTEPAASQSTPSETSTSQSSDKAAQGGAAQKQRYPLYPSVERLLHQNNLTNDDADRIPATGPGGRLLKGDVLAHLGAVSKDYPAQSSARFEKLAHLDLSNIQLAPQPEPKAKAPEQVAEVEGPTQTEVAIPISLSQVIATQKRVQDSLGIFLPLSTFIARASELANDELPLGKGHRPTADDLFNAVLGLSQVSTSRGNYYPQITALAPIPLSAPARTAEKPDIIDMLAPKPTKPRAPRPAPAGIAAGPNSFAVTAESGEESRALEYLERMKLALEKEPGRLVV